MKWTHLEQGDYETQGEHAYWRLHFNTTTERWHVGRRLYADKPIVLVAIKEELVDAMHVAEVREASL